MAESEETPFRLMSLPERIDQAIERFRTFEPPEGYFLAFSGGKDSITIKRLADMAGVKYDAHYNVTTLDPKELVWFIKKHHAEVTWDRSEKSFEAMLLKKRFPPMRTQRWCCELLKESGGEGRIIVTGVRQAESRFRRKRRVMEACYRGPARHFLNPIIDWNDTEVWGFIRDQGLPYCELYDRGHKRIGCLFCPCAGPVERRRHEVEYPRVKRRLVKLLQRLIDLRQQPPNKPVSWQTGEEFFEWWIKDHRGGKKDAPGQVMIFD